MEHKKDSGQKEYIVGKTLIKAIHSKNSTKTSGLDKTGQSFGSPKEAYMGSSHKIQKERYIDPLFEHLDGVIDDLDLSYDIMKDVEVQNAQNLLLIDKLNPNRFKPKPKLENNMSIKITDIDKTPEKPIKKSLKEYISKKPKKKVTKKVEFWKKNKDEILAHIIFDFLLVHDEDIVTQNQKNKEKYEDMSYSDIEEKNCVREFVTQDEYDRMKEMNSYDYIYAINECLTCSEKDFLIMDCSYKNRSVLVQPPTFFRDIEFVGEEEFYQKKMKEPESPYDKSKAVQKDKIAELSKYRLNKEADEPFNNTEKVKDRNSKTKNVLSKGLDPKMIPNFKSGRSISKSGRSINLSARSISKSKEITTKEGQKSKLPSNKQITGKIVINSPSKPVKLTYFD